MDHCKSQQIKLETHIDNEVELCDEIKIEIKEEPDDSSEESVYLSEDNEYLSKLTHPVDSISKLNEMLKPYIYDKRQNNFEDPDATPCKLMKSADKMIKRKHNPKDTLGHYLAAEINKVTCPHLNQELTLKVHLLIGEYVKMQIKKNRKISNDSRFAELPSDDCSS